MIWASLNLAFFIRILLGHFCRKNPTCEHHYFSGGLPNQGRGINFFDYVNGWRITDAKRLLLQDARQSVLGVGFEVGFNAKSTFNAAFRKHAGMTPSDWRQKNPIGGD
jgi:YesN/AraC family two-component response regulator